MDTLIAVAGFSLPFVGGTILYWFFFARKRQEMAGSLAASNIVRDAERRFGIAGFLMIGCSMVVLSGIGGSFPGWALAVTKVGLVVGAIALIGAVASRMRTKEHRRSDRHR